MCAIGEQRPTWVVRADHGLRSFSWLSWRGNSVKRRCKDACTASAGAKNGGIATLAEIAAGVAAPKMLDEHVSAVDAFGSPARGELHATILTRYLSPYQYDS